MQSFDIGDQYVFYKADPHGLKFSEEKIYQLIRAELDRHGIPHSQYSLGVPDGPSDGCVCFHEEGVFWTYYISERGLRYRSAFFSSPSDGMNYLVWMFIGNPKKRNSDVGFLPYLGESL